MTKYAKIKRKKVATSIDAELRKTKTIRITGKKGNIKHGNIRPHTIWSIDSIISNIFKYFEYRDFMKFNTVCKRWNRLTNPTIYRSVKMLRCKKILNNIYGKISEKNKITEAEVKECISSNSKHANLIKEFKYSEKLEPQTACKFFESFKFIEKLVFSSIEINQDEIINILKSLSLLEKLKFDNTKIINSNECRYDLEDIQLPSTLKRLTEKHVTFSGNDVRLIQSINFHSNIVKFSYFGCEQIHDLDPFSKNFPSLKLFKYINIKLENSQPLFNLIKYNPQLISLKLCLSCFDNELLNNINQYLAHLKHLCLVEHRSNRPSFPRFFLQFTQPINIKKLELNWIELSSNFLDSIMLNCLQLEELIIITREYICNEPQIFTSNLKRTNILKLELVCNSLSTDSLRYILLYCPHLKSLNIRLPKTYKEWFEVIGAQCAKLENLSICPAFNFSPEEKDILYKELCETEYLANTSIYNINLTHLTLNELDFRNFKPEYLLNFSKLQTVKFQWQTRIKRLSNREIYKYLDLWPTFRLRSHGISKHHHYYVELGKL